MGVRLLTCEAHAMIGDQRTLDGLVFARYMLGRLLDEEFGLVTVELPIGAPE
jgi:hypothetical protein